MTIESYRANWPVSRRGVHGLLAAAAAAASLALVSGCSSESQSTTSDAVSSASSAGAGGSDGSGGSGNGAGGMSGAGGAMGTGGSGSGGGVPVWDPEAGWTNFMESADTIKVYVSSSGGNDSNDGLSEAKAVKTIAKGKTIIRNGMPDWLLLKRGDVWNEALGTWSKSGKSDADPLLVSTYGTAVERPLLKTGAKAALYAAPGSTVDHVAFVGLHLYAHTRDPDSPEFVGSAGEEGVRWLSTTKGLLLEDMHVQYYQGTDLTIQGSITDVRIRRNVITDAYDASGGHAQGIYAQEVTNLLIEENLFDHNGWNEDVNGAEKTIFNHNMYINVTCKNLVVTNNISVRAASHGLQARPGGVVSGNLFVDDPIAFSYGLVLGGSSPLPGGVTGEIMGNIVLSSADIEPEALPRGIGVQLANIKSAKFEDNIIAHDKSAKPYGDAIDVSNNGIGLQGFTMKNNIIYDWRGNLRFDSGATYMNVTIDNNQVQMLGNTTLLVSFSGGAPSAIKWSNNDWFSGADASKWFGAGSFDQWTAQSKETGGEAKKVKYKAPDRKISDYHASIGKAADFYAFLAEARKQSRKNYRYEYTTKAPMDFIRDGFQILP